jgi:PIN domain nuclease of toxin-antitoxin system
MKLLLDTQIFIWWADEPTRLSTQAFALCSDVNNELFLSVVSAWEIQIKVQLGKLRLNQPLEEVVKSQQQANELAILSVQFTHVLALKHLPQHHKDPFDRLLIAQAITEDLAILSVDFMFAQYPVKLFQ